MPNRSRLQRYTVCLLLFSLVSACGGQRVQPTLQPAPSQTSQPTRTVTLTPTAPPSPTRGAEPTATRPAPQARKTLLLAHTMPWFQTKAFSGAWGWHWTMNHFDPEKGAIASHFTPLTGPYDSSDPALLEYQVLLMKLAGIDGVIVDWYGSADFRDYAAINRSTQALFEYARKAGLKFAVCYEDQTLTHMLENQYLQTGEDIQQAQVDMRFLQQSWFQDTAYLKRDGRPVLLVFGPQHFKDGGDWKKIFAGVAPPPLLVSEDKTVWEASASSFPWPPMWASGNGTLTQKALDQYLNDFYLYAAEQPYKVAGAFPGFDDIYQEARVSSGYGVLEAQGGNTFRSTLETAIASNTDAIQLITWNDYGEGTNIEPAEEYGYIYLETLQDFRRQHIEPGFPSQAADLRLPLELYKLRKIHAADAAVNAELDQAFAAIINGDTQSATSILNRLK